MMRPLVMDFKNDPEAIRQSYQYMFGKAMLVAPVTAPDITTWNVYLPTSTTWFDFWTGKKYNGGQTIEAAAPQDKIPVFIRAGAIIPMGKMIQYTAQKPMDTLEVRVYKGASGGFSLYEDEGDNYNYEKGKYTVIPFKWEEKTRLLTIGARQGSYTGYQGKRVFNIVFAGEGTGTGVSESTIKKSVVYNGTKIVIAEK